MNSVSVSFENGAYEAKLVSYNSNSEIQELDLGLDSAVIDNIITAVSGFNNESCSFSFNKDYSSYGHKFLKIKSPNFSGQDCDQSTPLPENFDLSVFDFLGGYINIGGYNLTLEKEEDDFFIGGGDNFSSINYSYSDDLKNETEADFEDEKHRIPIVPGKVICVKNILGKNFLK